MDNLGRLLQKTKVGCYGMRYRSLLIQLAGLIREARPAVLELFTISPKDGTEQDKVAVRFRIEP